jgi:hypothetical protein
MIVFKLMCRASLSIVNLIEKDERNCCRVILVGDSVPDYFCHFILIVAESTVFDAANLLNIEICSLLCATCFLLTDAHVTDIACVANTRACTVHLFSFVERDEQEQKQRFRYLLCVQ